ncbi:MAG TPA: response regulator [Verrucomicrobiae bacterium]|jgi:signal transduction histidine kinase/CheY-like chemotaxis protein|nr:response regulator [Verrucomicrobiae bacterium]
MIAGTSATAQNAMALAGTESGPKIPFNDNAPGPRILVVEDERIVALDIAATLKQLGYKIAASVNSGEAAVREALTLRPNLVLMDIRLAGVMDGIQAAEAIKAEADIPVIYLTAHSDDSTLARAKNTCPAGYVVKPFKSADLHCAIEIALHKQEIKASLRERELWLAGTLKSIRNGVVAPDAENSGKFLNPVTEALTVWRSEETVGTTIDDLLNLVSNKDQSLLSNPLRAALLERSVKATEKSLGLASQGAKTIPVAKLAAPILDGVVVGDTTERRRAGGDTQERNAELERRVTERTAQLEAANKELESFSYSIAHDLRSPLNGITGFSEILIENHAANLGPEGLSCLHRIQLATDRMRHLIDDLLRLARVARHDFKRTSVDVTELAAKVLAELQSMRQDPQVHCIVQPGVTLEGDGALLRIVLENLLGNAWKFSSKVAAPEIEFGSFAHEGKQVCYVRDNGAGFDPQYAGQMFVAFRRLHSAQEFEGTGIGLAIVDRIIQRHGGRIWAESAPDKGATFFFTV